LARIFAGTDPIQGSQPLAQAYAGHQFGGFTPQLGDGRAVLLGEIVDGSGERFDLQLKGSGRTPFSRGGDGKSWLGPVLREYILSEAMHRLGVPTTRALAAVATGETVYREEPLPGAVFTRVAASHLRVGTFQFFAARQDAASVRTLANYAIERHYPEAGAEGEPYLAFFRAVMARQAELIANWMAVGFIHGVMNTDNSTISGETIDYGPAAYLDEFSFRKVFSSIDQQGRYAYGNQPAIGQWNLARLAETLLLLDVPVEALEAALGEYPELYREHYLALMRPKLGLADAQPDDVELINDWLSHLEAEALDYTLSFRALADRAGADDPPQFGEVEARWRARLGDRPARETKARMDAVNPLYIARNHRVEQAIEQAVAGDLSIFEDLNRVLANPYEAQSGFEAYAEPPEPHERVTRTFCGT
ncbi:MAG: YdiU family protein, partial [Gammaproteobacteria bacterium]